MGWKARLGLVLLIVVCVLSTIGAAWAQQIEITFAKRYDAHGSIEAGQSYVERVIAEFERRNPHIKVHYQPLTGEWIDNRAHRRDRAGRLFGHVGDLQVVQASGGGMGVCQVSPLA